MTNKNEEYENRALSENRTEYNKAGWDSGSIRYINDDKKASRGPD